MRLVTLILVAEVWGSRHNAYMGLNEWIKMKIVIKNAQAKLYLNHNPQPVLIVNDLKLGASNRGAIGLFVDTGTDACFRDIKVVKEN